MADAPTTQSKVMDSLRIVATFHIGNLSITLRNDGNVAISNPYDTAMHVVPLKDLERAVSGLVLLKDEVLDAGKPAH